MVCILDDAYTRVSGHLTNVRVDRGLWKLTLVNKIAAAIVAVALVPWENNNSATAVDWGFTLQGAFEVILQVLLHNHRAFFPPSSVHA